MSWLEKNYEKAALGGAAVVALGMLFFGYTKLSGVPEAFTPTAASKPPVNDPAVKDADLITKAVSSMKLDRSVNQSMVGERPVDLFVGVPLYISSTDPTKPVDPWDGADIHPPIKNIWWIQNKLDPGFADAPQRDPDGDGFSNLEEFTAKTNPNDASSHPMLVSKVKYVKDESITWVIRPGFESDGGFSFRYEDSNKGQNKTDPAVMITPGNSFFATEPQKDRFKLLSSEQRKEFNKNTNVEREFTIVKIEDQRPNKKGRVYELPAPLSEERKMEHVQYDRTAIVTLEAIGEGGKEFKVEEGTTFAVPFDAAEKNFLMKEVTPDQIVIEYTDADGSKKELTVAKGATP